jgi:hypothetical protein
MTGPFDGKVVGITGAAGGISAARCVERSRSFGRALPPLPPPRCPALLQRDAPAGAVRAQVLAEQVWFLGWAMHRLKHAVFAEPRCPECAKPWSPAEHPPRSRQKP